MHPVQNRIPNNQQRAPQEGTGKRSRSTEIEERTEDATKKRRLIEDTASPIHGDVLVKGLSPVNESIAEKIETVKETNPAFPARPAKPLSLQGEIIHFIEEEIRSVLSREIVIFKYENQDQILSLLNQLKDLALSDRLGEVVTAGESQGASIPWLLAKKTNWQLLEKMRENKIDIDFNSSPASGAYQGFSIFLLAIMRKQPDLVRFLLKNKIPNNINALIERGPLAGVNALFLAAYSKEWDLVKEILHAYPDADVNCSIIKDLPGTPAKATVVHLAALAQKWDIVQSILERSHVCRVDAVLETGPMPGTTLLFMAALCKQWDCFLYILKKYPGQDINAIVQPGWNVIVTLPGNIKVQMNELAGMTVLCSAGMQKRWNVISTILDLYPHASVNAAPLQGFYQGWTPLLMAAEALQWELVLKMLKLQPDADVDTTYERSPIKGATPFWRAVKAGEFPIAFKMLSLKPRLNLECNLGPSLPISMALQDKRYGFAKLLLLLGAKDPPPDVLVPGEVDGKPTDIPAPQIAAILRQELELTHARIYDTLYNSWNQPENATFAWIRKTPELRAQIACEVLIAEHPDIPVFPGLPAVIEEWANLDRQRNRAAKERTAILALRLYRWNNGIEGLTPKVIKDIRLLIVESLGEAEKNSPFEYRKEIRHKFVQQIGEEQTRPPRLTRSFVQKAITNALTAPIKEEN